MALDKFDAHQERRIAGTPPPTVSRICAQIFFCSIPDLALQRRAHHDLVAAMSRPHVEIPPALHTALRVVCAKRRKKLKDLMAERGGFLLTPEERDELGVAHPKRIAKFNKRSTAEGEEP